MKDVYMFKQEIEDVLKSGSLQRIYEFVGENIYEFFSTPFIPVYYRILKDVDFSISAGPLPRLIICWMAFLSGDHGGTFLHIKSIRETDLLNPQDSALYYSLKAFTETMAGSGDGLRYAKLALDILPSENEDLYLANAKLTYGQLLSSSRQYRLAAEMFSSSYKIFSSLDMGFPAVVAMANEALNLYKLGEGLKVIDKCNSALMMAGRFKCETEDYRDVVNLPLGMCYYELNKPSLAVEHLKKAKASIDKSELFHMHGLIELYLFKSYHLTNDRESMEHILGQSISNFESMHHINFDLLISMFKIILHGQTDGMDVQADIEKMEFEYIKNPSYCDSVVVDTLAFLKTMGKSDTIDIDGLQKRLEVLRYTGNVPHIQQCLIHIAELYYMEGKQSQASGFLTEAVQIYKDYGISAGFHTLPLKSAEVLKNLDMRIYTKIFGKGGVQSAVPSRSSSLLSQREKEIMRLIAEGKSNEEISRTIYIGIGTIKWHTNNIFSKLQVKNRVQAVEKARSLGEI